MQHFETRAASRRRPAPASLLAATLLAALNGGAHAQTALPVAAPVAPGFPSAATPGAPVHGAPNPLQPAAPPAPFSQAAVPGTTAPAAPAVTASQAGVAPPAAPVSGAGPIQPFPGAAMGAPSYNAAVPQPARPATLPQPDRPGYGTAPPHAAARAPVPALPTVQSPPVKGLPADAPKLVINGGVHSPNPAKRLVIVNGQVVREGADLGAGLVLEQIRPDSVVLGFRGGHFHVMY